MSSSSQVSQLCFTKWETATRFRCPSGCDPALCLQLLYCCWSMFWTARPRCSSCLELPGCLSLVQLCLRHVSNTGCQCYYPSGNVDHAALPEGVGLGAVLVKAKTIKDEMFIAAARALADYGGWCFDWNMHFLLAAADHAALPVCALKSEELQPTGR